jgi:hypothetical protein
MTDRTSRARAKVATKPVLGHYVHNMQSILLQARHFRPRGH